MTSVCGLMFVLVVVFKSSKILVDLHCTGIGEGFFPFFLFFFFSFSLTVCTSYCTKTGLCYFEC